MAAEKARMVVETLAWISDGQWRNRRVRKLVPGERGPEARRRARHGEEGHPWAVARERDKQGGGRRDSDGHACRRFEAEAPGEGLPEERGCDAAGRLPRMATKPYRPG